MQVIEKPEHPAAEDVEQEVPGRMRAPVRRYPKVRMLPPLPVSELVLELEPAAASTLERLPTVRGHDVSRHFPPPFGPPAGELSPLPADGLGELEVQAIRGEGPALAARDLGL